jgi:hypothetical protein
MNQYTVYERRCGNLYHVSDVRAATAEIALSEWINNFGDNYGKVIILPCLPLSSHHALEAGVTA